MGVLPVETHADPDVLWAVGGETLGRTGKFTVVQDLFLTEAARQADIVLPSASAYEKSGTVTNVTGEVQRLKPAIRTMGTKPDLEIMGLIAREMGLNLGIWTGEAIFAEIQAVTHGYNVALPVIQTGGAAQTQAVNGRDKAKLRPDSIASAGDTLFTSGTLGRYSRNLTTVLEAPGGLYRA
jgi:NADH-quinone oxidoreductase subunit G